MLLPLGGSVTGPSPVPAVPQFLVGTVETVAGVQASVRFVGGVIPCVVCVSVVGGVHPGDEVIVVPALSGAGSLHVVLAVLSHVK